MLDLIKSIGPFELVAGGIIIALLLTAAMAIREHRRLHSKPKRPTKDDTIGNDDPRLP